MRKTQVYEKACCLFTPFAMPLLVDLPAELLNLILKGGKVTKKDLKALRLQCRRLESVASPLLFDEILISLYDADLDIARAVLPKFGSHIRTLVVLPVYETQYNSHGDNYDLERPDDFRKDQEKLASYYRTLFAEQKKNLRSGTPERLIEEVFRLAHKIQAVIFEKSRGTRQRPLVKLTGLRHAYRWPASWALTMEELARKTHLRELRVGEHDESLVASETLFLHTIHMATQPVNHFATILPQLEILQLKFEKEEGHEDGIADALAQAVNLKTLSLATRKVKYNNITTFNMLFKGCKFPKLQTLMLYRVVCKEKEIEQLMRGSPLLNIVIFIGLILSSGRWDALAERMQPFLCKARYIFWTRLFEGYISNGHGYEDHSQETPRFFRNGEDNPFTKERPPDFGADGWNIDPSVRYAHERQFPVFGCDLEEHVDAMLRDSELAD